MIVSKVKADLQYTCVLVNNSKLAWHVRAPLFFSQSKITCVGLSVLSS